MCESNEEKEIESGYVWRRWLFKHTSILGNSCKVIKGYVKEEVVNIKWQDEIILESIEVIYDDTY